MTTTLIPSDTVTIRRASDADLADLERLATLDSGRLPSGDLLVAEAGGEIRAALDILTREYVADPFYASRDLVALLDRRAARLRSDTVPVAERIRARVSLWNALVWRAGELHRTQ